MNRRQVDRRRSLVSRRGFLGAGLLATAGMLVPRTLASRSAEVPRPPGRPPLPTIRPPRLRPGDTIGIINPCSVPPQPGDRQSLEMTLASLGLRARVGKGFDATDDRARAADVTAMFADPTVKGIMPVRGGWGCARLLQHLDYEVIRRHPKVVIGFSDMASLLLGIHNRTGLVTFHGPMGVSSWDEFETEGARRVLFDPTPMTLVNPVDAPIETLTPGTARGRLLGGNLTVLTSMLGSRFMPAGGDLIVFLEEVRESTSEVDRMLTQLEMGGLLRQARGVVFGECTRCSTPPMDRSLTLEEVMNTRVKPLGVPAWTGARIGHGDDQLTVPIGVQVEIDAARGTIRLLEGAVV